VGRIAVRGETLRGFWQSECAALPKKRGTKFPI